MALAQQFPRDEDRPLSNSAALSHPDARELEAHDRSLKGRQELALLFRLLGPLEDRRCLLVGGGNQSGALNFHLRAAGGSWEWAHTNKERLWSVASLLGEPVSHVAASRIPFPEGRFHCVVVLHALQSTEDPQEFMAEVRRVLAPGGDAVIMCPAPRRSLILDLVHRPANRESHPTPNGSSVDVDAAVGAAGLVPYLRGSCARFFTEAIDLAFNGSSPRPRPHVLLRTVAALDHLIPWARGHTVGIVARKPR